MEALEGLLIDTGAHLVECWGWPAAGGEYHTYGRHGVILLDVSLPPRRKRWILAHELGHHLSVVMLHGDRKLAEGKADLKAVKILAERYLFGEIEWPERVLPLLSVFYPEEFGGEDWAAA